RFHRCRNRAVARRYHEPQADCRRGCTRSRGAAIRRPWPPARSGALLAPQAPDRSPWLAERASPAPARTQEYLAQSELGQLGAERRRQVVGRSLGQIGRRVLWSEIAPALERPARTPVRRHQLRREYEPAASDPLIVGERLHVEQALPDLH